ncbi:siderophore-interacting protein (plasmid) [Acaryochloris sp. 'Moss Beach']|nr:siderophore-interacting protein [Acaryochloris sp. 'Moss Beach']
MRRIVLRGNDLQDFPVGQESAHVKVIVPQPGETKPKLEFNSGAKKWIRSYTVRAFDTEQHRLTIDFSVNNHSGIVADWAVQARPGDYLGIGGPGPVKHTDFSADWHLIVGDFSALPALAATVEKLPTSSKGYVLAQVPTVQDQQHIDVPPNMNFQWIVNPDVSCNELLKHIQKIDWMDGQPAIFIAGEESQMKAMHGYVKTQPGYTKTKTYASGYWKA